MIYEYDTNYINAIIRNKKKILSHELMKVLLYFDIFQYPLTTKEIKRFCGTVATIEEVEYELGFLERLGYIQRKDIFYSIASNDISSMVDRRRAGNARALKMLKKANSYSKLISYFPFVRGIYLSGSLSKGYADKKSDVDYFIITEPRRLWLCRMLLTLFKKVFLFNSHKYFCINYFIDTESLEIPDKNIFTAIELTTLVTTSNSALYRKLIQANSWVKDFFPNTLLESISGESKSSNESWIKRFIEKVFYGKMGDRLDDFCFEITFAKAKRKFKRFSRDEFELNMRSKKNVSKHHPRGFQAKVLNQYNGKIRDFEQQFQINLS